ncbi:MAG: hypothetical protein JXQ27_00870 [Acidobacteria bacterium]|nr:hypothetical protein [Acidobacteriota bacterium]
MDQPRMNICRYLVIVGGTMLFLGVFTTRPAAQSVADLARKNRDGEKKKTQRVYTNLDLEQARGHMAHSTLPPEGATPAALESSGYPGEENKRERFHRLFQENFDWIAHARQAVARATRERDTARFKLENARPVRQHILTNQGYLTYWYHRADPATVRRLEQALARCEWELWQAEADLAAAEKSLANLERDARRQDVPPGVLRKARKDWEENASAATR